MASLKELRQRQKTIGSIERMTSAMKMVAQSKLKKGQGMLAQSRILYDAVYDIASRLCTMADEKGRGLPTLRTEGKSSAPVVVVVMTSETGMCGGFIQKMIKKAQEVVSNLKGRPIEMVCVGKKGVTQLAGLLSGIYAQNGKSHPLEECDTRKDESHRDAHHHGGYEDVEKHPYLKEENHGDRTERTGTVIQMALKPEPILALGQTLCQRFLAHEISGVILVCGHFRNILTQEPMHINLLPLAIEGHGDGDKVKDGLLMCDPNVDKVLDQALKLLYEALWQLRYRDHCVSEYGARMAAMDAAQDNAKEMLSLLKFQYNHLRQSLITKELIEIISGAKAIG